MGIGSRIRQERQRQNLDMRELAKLSGIPERTLADIEREVTSPRADNLKRLIISLGNLRTSLQLCENPRNT